MTKVTNNFSFLFEDIEDSKANMKEWNILREKIIEIENRLINNDLDYSYNLNIYKALFFPFSKYLLNENFIHRNELKPGWELKDLLDFIHDNYRNQFDPLIIYFLKTIRMKRNNEAHNNYLKGQSEIISSLKYLWYVLYYFAYNKHPEKDFDESVYYDNAKHITNKSNVLNNNNTPENNVISTKEIDISKDKLRNWLVETKIINIPIYQREYTWNINHCKNLYDDIKLRVQDDGIHYFGVIAAKIQDNKIKIIDGQQRLITSILFCCAVRENMKKIDNDFYKDSKVYSVLNRGNPLDTYYENPTGLAESNECLKFILDDELDKLSEEHKKTQVYINFEYFTKELAKDIEAKETIGEKIEFLNFTSIVFLQKFILATISLDELTNPKRELSIAENINSKGQALEFIDFCKTYLFWLCENEELVKNDGLELMKSYFSIFSSIDKKENEKFFEFLIKSETKKSSPSTILGKLELFKETISNILNSLNILDNKKLNLVEFQSLTQKLKQLNDEYYLANGLQNKIPS